MAGVDLDAPTEAGGRVVLPLGVPLACSGEGALRCFAALVLERAPTAEARDGLARAACSALVQAGLRRIADADPLTGLPARAAFERALRASSERVARGERLALLLCDVDGLRDLNALRGRRVGDDLLRTLAALLQAAHPGGLVARHGDDELALLAPDLDAAGAAALAARLRASLAAAEGLGAPPPTIGVGIAAAPEHGEEAEELLLRADQALGRAKDEGPDRAVVWRPELLRQRRQDLLAGVLTGRPARDQRHARALLETVQAVSRLAPLAETLVAVVDRCVEVADAERGLLLLRGEDGWIVRAARGPGGAELAAADRAFAASIAEAALEQGRTVSRLAEDGPLSPSAERLGLAAALCAPLQGEDVPAGVVYVDTRRRAAPFEPATLAFFDALCAQLGVALRNAALYQRLLEGSERLRAGVDGREQELVRARRRFQELAASKHEVPGMVGASAAMQEVFRLLASLEGTNVPVVIEGESGTGKELVARAIHGRSGRKGPLITVNCAAIAAGLFESELFGHADGAFTGARGDREGLLEAANGGTIFLDEVGELPLEAQAKLLRALQEREVRRLGDTRTRPIDVRVVAATNRDLEAMVRAGEFREDLFYRLAVFRLFLPPLRKRSEDLPALVEHLLGELPGGPRPSSAALRALTRSSWPGNVRQLRNVLQRAAVLAGGGRIEEEHLDLPEERRAAGPFDPGELLRLPLAEAKTAFAEGYAREMIRRAGGSYPEAAKLAGVTRQTLYRILGNAED
ncbi:MAG: sigma 54-interacting transcriptional regulator [Planctomycetota bacterium]